MARAQHLLLATSADERYLPHLPSATCTRKGRLLHSRIDIGEEVQDAANKMRDRSRVQRTSVITSDIRVHKPFNFLSGIRQNQVQPETHPIYGNIPTFFDYRNVGDKNLKSTMRVNFPDTVNVVNYKNIFLNPNESNSSSHAYDSNETFLTPTDFRMRLNNFPRANSTEDSASNNNYNLTNENIS